MKNRIPVHRRIVFKIPLLIAAALVLGLGFMSFFFAKAQIDIVYKSQEATVSDVAEILFRSIKSNMLAGEAEIAVTLVKELSLADSNSTIHIYDADGNPAFSTNNTIELVNDYLQEKRFLLKTALDDSQMVYNRETFFESVNEVKDIVAYTERDGVTSIEIYKPLVNQPKCNTCHGVDHVTRGLIFVSHELTDEQNMADATQRIAIVLFAVMVTALTATIIIFLRRYVIRRILHIGEVVEKIGRGNFDQKITITHEDELGILAGEINKMITGLKEKFRLTKFVSRSTLEFVKNDEEIVLGGSKKTVTVLFTDIRGFTHYSEAREPEEVLDALNRLMNLQVEVVNLAGGDIDKFVGDELMAVFTGENAAIKAVKAALEIKKRITNFDRGDGQPFYVGIGINTGEVILGNMGSASRIDRTVIGNTVNLGSRLCSVAGKNTIILSSQTWALVRDKVTCIKQEPIFLKGKTEPVTAYILKGLV